MNDKFVSIKAVIAKVIRDYGFSNVNWFDFAVDWTAEALREIGTIVPYEQVSITKKIVDNKIPLPCSIEVLLGVTDSHGCALPRYRQTVKGIKAYNEQSNSTGYNHYIVTNGSLHFNYTDEEVTITYLDFKLDEDGYPMISDNQFVINAIVYYIVAKLLLRGIPHPVMNWQTAQAMWIEEKAKAGNSLMMISPDEMDAVMAGWLTTIPHYNLKW